MFHRKQGTFQARVPADGIPSFQTCSAMTCVKARAARCCGDSRGAYGLGSSSILTGIDRGSIKNGKIYLWDQQFCLNILGNYGDTMEIYKWHTNKRMEWDKQSSTMIFIAKFMMYCKSFFQQIRGKYPFRIGGTKTCGDIMGYKLQTVWDGFVRILVIPLACGGLTDNNP